MPSLTSAQFPIFWAQWLVTAWFAVCFLQSGIDKVVDWKGNLGWLSGHFAKSPLRNVVPAMLGILTVLEIVAGVLCAVGVVMLLLGNPVPARWGLALVGLTLLGLFSGQRIAKDYAGASGLVPYFITAIAGIWLLAL